MWSSHTTNRVLACLASSTALSLILLDEYESVQQHLQPRHIQEMITPVPDDWSKAQNIINAGLKLIAAMESLSLADNVIQNWSLSRQFPDRFQEF